MRSDDVVKIVLEGLAAVGNVARGDEHPLPITTEYMHYFTSIRGQVAINSVCKVVDCPGLFN